LLPETLVAICGARTIHHPHDASLQGANSYAVSPQKRLAV
jgi:hypothetical protein